jgi:hypothetical protein
MLCLGGVKMVRIRAPPEDTKTDQGGRRGLP